MGTKKPMTFFIQSLLLFLWILIVGVLCFLWPYFEPIFQKLWAILTPILIAALIAYLIHPLINGLKQWGIPKLASIIFVFLLCVVAIILACIYGIPAIYRQVQSVMEVLPDQVNRITTYVHSWEDSLHQIPTFLQGHIDDWSNEVLVFVEHSVDRLETILVNVARSLPSLLVIPFLVFYFLKDDVLIKKVFWYLTPVKWRKRLSLYGRDVDHSFGSYIRGQLLVAMIVAVLSMIGLWFLDVPYAVLLGLFIGVTDIIPYFGSVIGAIPAIITAFLISWEKALYTLIVLLVIQQIEGNLLSPFIVGRTLHLHPMLIILALIVGVELGGILGLLIAVPGLAVLKVTLLHARRHIQGD